MKFRQATLILLFLCSGQAVLAQGTATQGRNDLIQDRNDLTQDRNDLTRARHESTPARYELNSADNASLLAQSEASQPFVLQGGVEHSEKLAPVEKSYRHGAKIDQEKPAKDASGNHWYMLPAWAVGSWTSTKSTRTYARNLLTNQEQAFPETRVTKMAFSWGFQQDKEGNVWEFAKEPYVLTLDSSEHKVVKRILQRDFVVANESKIILKMLTENIVVDKDSDRISRTLQVENIQTCVPAPHACMSCSATYKIFDEMGKAIELGKELNTARRVSPFKSVDEYEGKNMRLLFTEFLKAHSREDLI